MPVQFDALRAEMWKTAADDQLLEGVLIERLLALLGTRLHARRALWLASLDGDLICEREWCADSVAPLGELRLARGDKAQLVAAGGRVLSTSALADAGSRLGAGRLLAAPCPGHERIEGALALLRGPRDPAWPKAAPSFLAEAAAIFTNALGRRRAEAAARQSELRHRIVSQLCTHRAFAVAFEPAGPPLLEWTSAPEAPGGQASFESLLGRVRSEDRPRVLQMVEQARRNVAGKGRIEATALDGAPQIFEVEYRPVWDAAAGRVVRAFGLARDITEHIRAEDELRRERDLLRAVLEASPDGIVLASLKDEIIDCNAAAWRTAGCSSREEMLGRPVFTFVGEGDRSQAMALQEAARSGQPVRGVRWKARGADGREFPMQLSLGLVRTPAGKPWGVVAVMKNLTEQMELDARILQAQKAESLSVLAGGAAHDFNNLLAAIVGNAELALEQLPAQSPGRDELRQVLAAGERAAGLTRQLLEFAGKGQLTLAPLDVSAVISQLAPLLESSLSKKVSLKLDLARALPLVMADARQLRQVALNLVVNSAEAVGDRPGSVVVRTGARHCDRASLAQASFGGGLAEGEYVFLEVSDDGCGMSPETLAQVFDPFFTTKFTGRGLGLAAVQGAVRAHRGAVTVESEPGEGSTFRVLLPAAPAAQLVRSAPAPLVSGGKVLLADDEELVLRTTRLLLERAGFTVETAPDGQAALEALARDPSGFRLAVLDQRMPVLGGAEALGRLRELRPDLPVLLVSGQPNEGPRQDPRVAFVAKPFTRDELLEAIARLLGGAGGRNA